MKMKWSLWRLAAALFSLALLAGVGFRAHAAPPAQSQWFIEVYQDVTVRGGPGTYYDRVGLLIPGQSSPVLGRSPDNAWLKIAYVGAPNNEGWVFRDFVRLVGDDPNMPTILPPPTPTLIPTPTPPLDAVLGAGSPTPNPNANRPPTFTPPAPHVRPTLLPAQGLGPSGGFPPAVIIAVLFVLGSFGGVLSLFRSRR
jgi:hypothetical protein